MKNYFFKKNFLNWYIYIINQSASECLIRSIIYLNSLFGLDNNLEGWSNSVIYPSFKTIILSEFIIVVTLCAIDIIATF